MTIGVWILGDQLIANHPILAELEANKKDVIVILIESLNHIKKRNYHQQKLIFIWSAMRHYAEELRINNWQVDYQIVEHFDEGLFNIIQKYSLTEIRTITPCDRTFLQSIKNLKLDCEVKLSPNPNFLWQPEEFKQWADKEKG